MKLIKIQRELNAPKGQYNSFGKYNYRSCEDILKAVKPLLDGCILLLSDEVVCIGERNYVKATATLIEDGKPVSASGYAREALVKKGMDESQITGAASSYARKYALNGLFAIDDTKDADSTNNHDQDKEPPHEEKQWYNDFDKQKATMLAKIKSGERTPDQIISKLSETYKLSKDTREKIKQLGA